MEIAWVQMSPKKWIRREEAAIEETAGDWLARRDRGFTPAEGEEFARWSAADPRHTSTFARLSAAWDGLDTAHEFPEVMEIANQIKATREPSRWRRRSVPWITAAFGAFAAAMAIVLWKGHGAEKQVTAEPSYQVIPGSAHEMMLADGTRVELNADAEVEPAFTPTERRVLLIRGEAHFSVVKDPARAFIVQAGTISVSAVGTAFNVRLDPKAIEVLVTEGRVRVDDAHGQSLLAKTAEPSIPPDLNKLPGADSADAQALDYNVLSAGQRAVIPLAATGPVSVVSSSPAEIDRALAWEGPQLVFDHTPLEQAIAAFNRFNHRQLILGDPAIAHRKLGGTFRADNVDAFVRLLETGFEITAERRGDAEISLWPAK